MPNYTVRSGDTLSRIAQQNGITLQQLLAMNPQFQANPNLIMPGQTVKLTQAATPAATSAPGSYTPEQVAAETAKKTKALESNSLTKSYISYGNTAEQLANAYATKDWSQMTDEQGKPFSVQDQQDALNKAMEVDKAYYEQQKTKETADTEASLAQKQADYQNYLLTSGQQFEQDKITADQSAANQGVLFSGGRVQKEKNLERSYAQDQSVKQGSLGRDIASTARDYQYKYGNNAAQSLSQYYNLGGNTYNANVATGGVSSSGLSNIYNPSTNNFAGTRLGEQAGMAQKKASGLLWNKGNKLLATGYTNQY